MSYSSAYPAYPQIWRHSREGGGCYLKEKGERGESRSTDRDHSSSDRSQDCALASGPWMLPEYKCWPLSLLKGTIQQTALVKGGGTFLSLFGPTPGCPVKPQGKFLEPTHWPVTYDL